MVPVDQLKAWFLTSEGVARAKGCLWVDFLGYEFFFI